MKRTKRISPNKSLLSRMIACDQKESSSHYKIQTVRMGNSLLNIYPVDTYPINVVHVVKGKIRKRKNNDARKVLVSVMKRMPSLMLRRLAYDMDR